MFNPLHPPPAPPCFANDLVSPEENTTFFSRLFFQWLGPFLAVGFSRPLENEDLWRLPPKHTAGSITDDIEVNFYSRCPPEHRPFALRHKIPSGVENTHSPRKSSSDVEKAVLDTEENVAAQTGYGLSLAKALHRKFFVRFWSAGFCVLVLETLETTTPLLTKLLLAWLTASYDYYRLSDEQKVSGLVDRPPGIGYGIGLAFAIFAMQGMIVLLMNHSLHLNMTTGLLLRTGVIGSIFRKSLRLSGRARIEHSVGTITTMISADANHLDQLCMYIHHIWVAPIQIAIVVWLLVNNLRYSALVGVCALVLSFPMQVFIGRIMVGLRKKCVKITDARVRSTTEVLQGIRLIKFYASETFYSLQIGTLRQKEIRVIKQAAFARSALTAVSTFIPVLASVLSFITYGLTGHNLDVAIIFSSLQLFNIIRTHLMYFPLNAIAVSDALVAMGRISKFLTAEELSNQYIVNEHSNFAVEVNGTFTWETVEQPDSLSLHGRKPDKRNKQKIENMLSISEADVDEASGKPFELRDLCMTVPKGSFVAIVGRVGSGKSTILQALVGEMRRIKGDVIFGGSLAYAPQVAWIRNATLRENILFGQKLDEDRLREVISACGLERDLAMLPHGEETEIGEKGINLSGAQFTSSLARVSLARVAYSPSDIVLLDDPLSAVDACVGKSIVDNCLLKGPLASKTRILVTHALHVLNMVDYIYVVDKGTIKEQGTFADLMESSVIFSRIMEEYGAAEKDVDVPEKSDIADLKIVADKSDHRNGVLMQAEERHRGSVTWATYHDYLRAAGGVIWAPILLSLLILNQCSQVGNTVFLGIWTVDGIHGFTQGQYMAAYAALGVSQAVFTFLVAAGFNMAALFASLSLSKTSLTRVLSSPVSFFDMTPVGRILSRLSGDQDVLDNGLATNLAQFLIASSSFIGTFVLVLYTFPLLGIIFGPMIVLYYSVSLYYRRTSVETKRLGSLMRSALYRSYSETLTGLATIRAFNSQDRCVRSAESSLDSENRAYYMTISIQRWLNVRLDLLGNILILGITLFAAGYRNTISPSKIGVILTYTLNTSMVTQFAQIEQNMNAVERVLVYTQLPLEGNSNTSADEPSAEWPENGSIGFEDVDLAYREGLPLVLRDVSFKINPGEKVGIVGRTGAEFSTLAHSYFRIVELRRGSITIDGRDISKMKLDTLRSRLALVPQDTTMFLGSLRHNLDPQGSKTDAELISVLQRAWLLPPDGVNNPIAEAKFSLDATVGDEGSNFSAGEKQLLALGRALVKNSQIIVLDEATSSVDVETDAKLQKTIQTEFASATVLCIAHRLNTIAYYDRIMVMEAGQVAEFDTVINLFDKEDSIFRSLCNEANLQRSDIEHIRIDHGKTAL
ncbi:multidrug resistance-associated ABC transporter [Desarmillaria tabescens]|uniref:Multidrug resistance-associated ABC transporter n=1 Tax=Armillaria tabescens TaxID=1929756 RepID=A0AA39NLF7_ARMTA|nr:multidrug resistance-associated ABC transporter [Desarmillaria tabescens]KAK0467750.1 multidrug resistance-associated ABC transporter [Desarmillaria tabescens]